MALNMSRQNSQCEICGKEFKSNIGLKNHFNVIHKLMKEHQCNICEKCILILFIMEKKITNVNHVESIFQEQESYSSRWSKRSQM